jgi:ribosomal protein L11 methyltransferase
VIRLALRVRWADAELVLADLLELAPSGVEELELPALADDERMVEYAVYGAPGELPDLPDLRAAAGGALVDISTSEVPDDWSERWKRFHRPVLIEVAAESPLYPDGDGKLTPRPLGGQSGQAFHVRPPWESSSVREEALEIVIDPAQAFGTGAHATTRLCLELMLELAASDPSRDALLDIGCGSGVLAIAAAKLGYGPVLALDNDRESVLAGVANAAVNEVEIEARRFDLRNDALPLHTGKRDRDWRKGDRDLGKGDRHGWKGDGNGVPAMSAASTDSDIQSYEAELTVVLANLLRPLLLELAATMPAAPRHLIASGLLREQADDVADAFAKRFGLSVRARRERGEWAALWLTRAREAQ